MLLHRTLTQVLHVCLDVFNSSVITHVFNLFSMLRFYIERFIVVCALSILIFRAYSYFCRLRCKSSILNKEIEKNGCGTAPSTRL